MAGHSTIRDLRTRPPALFKYDYICPYFSLSAFLCLCLSLTLCLSLSLPPSLSPLSLSLSLLMIKYNPKIHHKICFRNCDHSKLNTLIANYDFYLFGNIIGFSEPDSVLQIFVLSLKNTANIALNELKTRQHIQWFTSEIRVELRHRDWFLKHRSRGDYEKKSKE